MADETTGATSGRQIFAIGAATLLGALLLFLIWYFLIRTPYAAAFNDINSADAVTITQELDRLKTPYELADEGKTIMVPEDQVNAARVNILGGDLPLKGAVGFELFNNTDIGLTEFAQRINYQRALQGELARTIMALDEIETARVHLSLPESGIFEQDRRPAKASIAIASKLGKEIDGKVVRGIQQLVAAAVPELQASSVAIVDGHGELLSAAPAEAAVVAAPMTPAQNRRAQYEQQVASQVEDAVRAAGLSMPMKVKVAALRSFEDSAAEVTKPKTAVPGAPALSGVIGANKPDALLPSGKRNYPLEVRLLVEATPDVFAENKLLETARQAIGFDEALGDKVVIETDPTMVSTAPNASAPPQTASPKISSPAAPSWHMSTIPIWPVLGGLVVLLVLYVAWRMRRSAKAPMAAEDRAAFTDRLKLLLDGES